MSDEFSSQVLAWAALALEQDPLLDFDGLVRALPGVHPNDVARIVGDQRETLRYAERGKIAVSLVKAFDGLPVPHPLDYDWRFTFSTRRLLVERANSLAPLRGAFTLLGTPTLFRELQRDRPDATICLADASAESISSLSLEFGKRNLFVCDLLEEGLPQMAVDVVIADPPWYPEFAEAFIWTAGQMVRLGGSLLLCGPNHGTRPRAEAEWSRIERYAQSLGFDLMRFESSLRYDTPPFEHNALFASGHPLVSSDWRTGCLATFVRRRVARVQRPTFNSEANLWCDQSVGEVRWRVRRKAICESASPLLHEIVPGDVLNSVSRRDLRRSSVDVWTSGNRIFECSNTSTLVLVLRALAAGASSATFVERSISRQLTCAEKDVVEASEKQLKAIVEIEQREYLSAPENLIVS